MKKKNTIFRKFLCFLIKNERWFRDPKNIQKYFEAQMYLNSNMNNLI